MLKDRYLPPHRHCTRSIVAWEDSAKDISRRFHRTQLLVADNDIETLLRDIRQETRSMDGGAIKKAAGSKGRHADLYETYQDCLLLDY
jgi:hypothetical protein